MAASMSDLRSRAPAIPPTDPQPAGHLGYIQGLRAVAVLLVVAYHAGLPISGGYLGVDVFFVISGFVITGLLLRELRTSGRIRFLNFYRRRIRRLLPALATMLVATLLASLVLQSSFGDQQSTARIGAYASVFLANLALYRTSFGYFDAQANTYPLLHTWSLGVEEQFYLGFPLVLAISYLVFRGRRRLLSVSAVIVVISVASLAVFVLMAHGHPVLPFFAKAQEGSFYLPFTRLWEFGIGAVLAIWLLSFAPLQRMWAVATGLLGAVLLGYGVIEFAGDAAPVAGRLVIPVAGAALLVVAGRTEGTPVNRVLALPAMQWLGDTSYGWYLWHFPLIVFTASFWPANTFAKVVAAVVALGIARVSYRTVEQRFRYPDPTRSPRADARRTIALGLVCVALPLSLAAGLRFGAQQAWDSPAIRSMSAQILPLHYGWSDCSTGDPVERLPQCTIGADRPGSPIVLLGDSNAGQYTEALMTVSKKLNRPLILATQNGCPYADVQVIVPTPYDGEGCRLGVQHVVNYLRRQPPALVVVASVNVHIDAPNVSLRDPLTDQVARTRDAKRIVWRQGMVRTIDGLRADGDRVLMMRVNAQPGGIDSTGVEKWLPSTCRLVTALMDINHCGVSVSLSSENRRQADALAAEHYALVHTGASQLNLRSVLCPHGLCRTVVGSRWLYRDGTHLSVGESYALAPEFERAVRAAGAPGA